MIPLPLHYWLRNAHVPEPLLVRSKQGLSKDWAALDDLALRDQVLLVDIEIIDGEIATITPADTLSAYTVPSIDLRGGMVLPCFVDMHTHLDKGHLWERSPNPDGTFMAAMNALSQDLEQHHDATDLYRRMEFGLKCSYAHGTQAIRTHIDSGGKLARERFAVFQTLREQWADRVILQAVCLVALEDYLTPEGEQLANHMAEIGGVLGGVASMNSNIEQQLDRTIALAKERKLNVDLHTDETDQPNSITLRYVAEAAIRHRFQGQIVCGHCCSLSVQTEDDVAATIAAVKQAKIGIVSLPMCNLYLQDRHPGKTPQWRGVTRLHELKQADVPVAIASDNCRDPFHAFGDHDALEVFSMSAKIAHLDRPYGDWLRTITTVPADLMGLPTVGRIGVGLPADLVLFKARRYSELLSRTQGDRRVLRRGTEIDPTLPDYAELDDLLFK